MLSNASGADVTVQPGPTDTTTDLSFCPVAEFFAASSWDNAVRVYQIINGQASPKTSYLHDLPALCTTWSQDGGKLCSGGADKQVRIMDMNSGQTIQFQAHEAPVRCCKWDATNNILVTGSWDKTVKYWDLRQAQPAATVALPERCYAMDLAANLLVVGTAERHVVLINMSQPTQINKTVLSPLKWQTRSIACMPQGNGYAIGSIEGRAGIQYVEEKRANESFAFKCHRTDSNAFAVNAMAFHPVHGTIATGGGDGSFQIWDKDSKQRLKSAQNLGGPITALAFSRHSDIIVYAIGYDWSKGYEHSLPNAKNGIFISKLAKAEIEAKSALKKRF